MRHWQSWWQILVTFSEYNPPQFIELLMLVLAIALLLVWGALDLLWNVSIRSWPYFALSLSYASGAAISTIVREAMLPSPQPRLTQVTAILLLIVSFYSFADLLRYF